jgi:hypothetical protein
MASTKYVIEHVRDVSADGGDVDLPDFARQQLHTTGSSLHGRTFASLAEMLAFIDPNRDLPGEGPKSIEQFVVRDVDGKACFDLWMFWADTGVVFQAGTAQKAGVGMIDGDFEADEEDTPDFELSEALAQATWKPRAG